MTTKTENILPENVQACFFDFDGIEVEVHRKEDNKYSIRVNPKNIELHPLFLPFEYKGSKEPRIVESSVNGHDWLIPTTCNMIGFHFKNGELMSYKNINNVLYSVKCGAAKLKELRELKEDADIRISLDKIIHNVFNFHGVKIDVRETKCDMYEVNIDYGIKISCDENDIIKMSKIPGSRGKFEGTSTFNCHRDGSFYLTRPINCERGESIEWKNGMVFEKKQLEYMLFSIRKTLDKFNELGIIAQKETVQAQEKKYPDHMWIKITPTEDLGSSDVILSVEGMKHAADVPEKYRHGRLACYSFLDRTYVVKSNGKDVFTTKFFKLAGHRMPKRHADEMVKVLGECAGTLYGINHPNFRGIIAKM